MKANQVAAALNKTPDAFVFLRRGSQWTEVMGVSATGEHRNAVTFDTIETLDTGTLDTGTPDTGTRSPRRGELSTRTQPTGTSSTGTG